MVRAPFPYFGGKGLIADQIWALLGDVPAYAEPFCGSAAVLLNRPATHTGYTETVNDADCFVANFWRAMKHDPGAVAEHVDWPVNECDLEARHGWLVNQAEWRARMKSDPDHYDAKIAGWWAWGACQWIGHGWCNRENSDDGTRERIPHLGDGRGVHRKQLPHLGDDGRGVHRKSTPNVLPWFEQLAARLRRVRVCCGDWSRIVTEAGVGLHHNTLAGVFLDPPYSNAMRADGCYTHDDGNVAQDCAAWAREHGSDPRYRIVLAGYAGEHDMPGWREIPWKTQGGYGNQGDGRGRENANKERLWASPHCLGGGIQASLF